MADLLSAWEAFANKNLAGGFAANSIPSDAFEAGYESGGAAALDRWVSAEKSRHASIDIDDGYGATCWRVKLCRGRSYLECHEVPFLVPQDYDGRPISEERDGNKFVTVVGEDEDWPGLSATILHAIEQANDFWSLRSEAKRD